MNTQAAQQHETRGHGEGLLEVVGVAKAYDSNAGANETPVLAGIDLAVVAGESIAIMGPSGSGKTTLLNLIGALDEPTAGHIRIGGEDVTAMNDEQRARLRNDKVGFIFQLHHLLPQCTALENVLLPTMVHPVTGGCEPVDQRAKRLLERVGLSERMHHRPGQLSGGERQRVALVRALINEPVLVLADEPTGSLDRTRADQMAQLLLEVNREESVALVVVTHDPTLAKKMSRTLFLRDGRLHDAAGEAQATGEAS